MSENHRYQKIPDVDTTGHSSISQKKSFSLGVSPRHVDIPMIGMSPLDIDMELADGKSGRSSPIDSNDEHERSLSLAVNASWAVNWFLLIAKGITYALSASKAVLAALVDSAVDLVSQAVLALAENYMSKFSPNYPVGRSRLEALSVIACAFIMSTASLEVVQYSASDLYEGVFHHKFPFLEVNLSLYVILGVGIVAKFVLWVYCVRLNTVAKSDMLEALAEDHLNDVLSNAAAMITASIAYNTTAWWVDPAGAILISVIIISRWINIIYEQVKKVVGHTAPQEFIDQLEELAKNHHEAIDVDVTRAYHFGARYNVEMEIVLPGKMTVEESHDIALALQHKIESLPDVERAFVHVDHQKRDGLEHKVERELVRASTGPSSPEHTLFQGNILPASYSSNA